MYLSRSEAKMINKIATFLLLVSLIGLGLSQRLLASGVSNTVGVKSAFELLCQNGATFVAGGAVNKKALRTEAVADIGTLATQLNVSQFEAATFLATAAEEIYTDRTAIDSCPR
jgi:hypothetical protein